METDPKAETRGEQTRRLIVETAIRLFGEVGYEKTTMRAIASAAGLSVGNAYYYFPSKDSLVTEFYLQLQREHMARAEEIIAAGGGFSEQLTGVLMAGLDLWDPYHSFGGRFIGIAAVPGSPTSPFSEESAEARELSLRIFERLVADTSLKMDAEVREELPELLWLAQLGLVVYWVHDRSPGQQRTRTLIETAVPYLESLVGLSRMKVFRAMTVRGLALVKLLRPV
ncbi:AcrR family transcriptional regulator [Allocatelliglobosispora scoriae]|uniref:AcrR family transcriptional regulator n=1 Tax=Allocatelliglobosispora scoriae TaxID=643052 RepID=A0A841BTC2_9ACTN|nr:TetR family transcriptional regulator [Allocatelliglobosispora scoriae]MBB5870666.1 AcrR family transcriptional regulator [Allocatelliglobosispora scoriae]